MVYNSVFLKAFNNVIGHEGAYSNDSSDLGAETMYGISKNSYSNLDIRNLKLDQAKQIYYTDFWNDGQCTDILNENIAIKFFEISVNVGIGQANILIQRALRAVGKVVDEDGVMGPITMKAINAVDDIVLLAALKSETAGYYRLLVQANPSQQKFITGWLNRAYS